MVSTRASNGMKHGSFTGSGGGVVVFFEICLKVVRAFAVDLYVTRKTRGPESHSDAARLKTESKGRLLRYYSSRERSSFGLGLFFVYLP